MNSDRIVNTAVIGTGRIGVLHAEHLAYRIPNAHLTAVADTDTTAAQACAQKLGVATAYDSPQAVFDDESVEAVVICTSTNTHSRLIEEAAEEPAEAPTEEPVEESLEESAEKEEWEVS